MSIEERSRERRRRMVGHRATSWEDAERWDLDFWQSMSPEERLSALVADDPRHQEDARILKLVRERRRRES